MTNKLRIYELSSLLKKRYIDFTINEVNTNPSEDVYSLSSEGVLDLVQECIFNNQLDESVTLIEMYKLIQNDFIYFKEIYLKSSEILNLADRNNKFIKQYGLMIQILKHINKIAITKSTLTYFIYLFIYDKIDISIIKPINDKYYEYILNSSISYYIVFK